MLLAQLLLLQMVLDRQALLLHGNASCGPTACGPTGCQASRLTMNCGMQASWLQALKDKQPVRPCQTCNRRVASMWSWLATMTAGDGVRRHTISGWPCLALQVWLLCRSLHFWFITPLSTDRLAFSACLDGKQSLSSCHARTRMDRDRGSPAALRPRTTPLKRQLPDMCWTCGTGDTLAFACVHQCGAQQAFANLRCRGSCPKCGAG